MHFYWPLGRISALTFDLDDILYDNRPVVTRTEQEALALVQNYHPALNPLQSNDLQRLYQAIHDAEPEIYHDATQWRHRIVEHAILEAGLSAAEARMGTNMTMMNFAKWHSRIEVPQTTYGALKALVHKWPLVAITDDNMQPELFGPDDYFEFVLRVGPDGRSRPFSNMYTLAAGKLKVPMGEVLHVGDGLTIGVAGVTCCGMWTCWIKPESADLMQTTNDRLLPHVEISQLASLTSPIQSPAELCIYTQLFGKWHCAYPPYLPLRGDASGRFLPTRQP